MWFNNYGDSFNSEDEAREDANYMIDWQDYEEQILKNDPLFFENLYNTSNKDDFYSMALEKAFESYFEENYYYTDDVIED